MKLVLLHFEKVCSEDQDPAEYLIISRPEDKNEYIEDALEDGYETTSEYPFIGDISLPIGSVLER